MPEADLILEINNLLEQAWNVLGDDKPSLLALEDQIRSVEFFVGKAKELLEKNNARD